MALSRMRQTESPSCSRELLRRSCVGIVGRIVPDVGHVHFTVQQALRVAEEAQVPNVVLYHISTRYTDSEIRDAIKNVAQNLDLKARVWAAMPRRVHWNLLSEKPVWEG